MRAILFLLCLIPSVCFADLPEKKPSTIIFTFCGAPFASLQNYIQVIPEAKQIFPTIDRIVEAMNQRGVNSVVEVSHLFHAECRGA